jgi:MFS family permease
VDDKDSLRSNHLGEAADSLTPPEGAGRDESRPARLPDAELRQSLWVILVSWGVFGSAWMSTVMGAPFPAFARDLGASTFIFGVISSLRFLAVIAQVPGAYWVERSRNRKRIFFLMHLPSRLSWLIVAALPWLVPETFEGLRIGVFMLILLTFSFMDSVGTVVWIPWVADIIPERIRARFLGQRQRMATLTAMLAAVIVGWLLDKQPEGSFVIYSVVFALAGILGAVDILLYLKVPDVSPAREAVFPLSEVFFRPLRDKRFRWYLLYAASSMASASVMGTFIWLYVMEALQLSKFMTNLYLITIGSLATILTVRTVGALADRFGNRAVLGLAWSLLALTPLLWVITSPSNHLLMTAASILGGIGGGATMILGTNLTFSMTPRTARSAYVAQVSLASGIAGFIAPILAGAIAQSLKGTEVSFFCWRFGNLHLLLVGLAAYRLLHTLFFVPRLPEARSVSTRTMLKEIVSARRRPKG